MLLIRTRNSVQYVYFVTIGWCEIFICEIYNFMHAFCLMYKNSDLYKSDWKLQGNTNT